MLLALNTSNDFSTTNTTTTNTNKINIIPTVKMNNMRMNMNPKRLNMDTGYSIFIL